MPAPARRDPVLAHNFTITLIDSASTLAGISVSLGAQTGDGGFSECSGLESTMQVDEHLEGGNNGTVLKFPGRVSWTNIKLRRGVILSGELWKWHYGFIEGKGKRRDGLITLQDDNRKSVRVWRFRRGIPMRWIGPILNAGTSAVAIEEIEIAHEGIKALPGGGANDLFGAVAEVGEAIGSLF